MDALDAEIATAFARAIGLLRQAGLPSDSTTPLERLADQIDYPCRVAVVGRVSAGKSMFTNALLKADLARVGGIETTATINEFVYGPKNSPPRCYWRTRPPSDVDSEFLSRLQGLSTDARELAAEIHHLEFRLPIDFLRRVTLVDTPGTQAVIEEHEQRTREDLGLMASPQQDGQQTAKLEGQTDAIFYLVEPAPGKAEKELLDAFRDVTQGRSRAFNAIGVIAKVDLYASVPDEASTGSATSAFRKVLEQSKSTADQLRGELNTVVPISAGIERYLDKLDQAGLRRLAIMLERVPAEVRSKLLESERRYNRLKSQDATLDLDDFRGQAEWRVFATVAQAVAQHGLDTDAAVAELRSIAGFDALRKLLQEHFVVRARLLRGARIVHQAREIVETLKIDGLRAVRRAEDAEQAQLARFTELLRGVRKDAGGAGRPEVADLAQELQDFLSERFPRKAKCVSQTLKRVDREIGRLHYMLQRRNADFEALQELDGSAADFCPEETKELQAVFGLHGLRVDDRLGGVGNAREQAASRQQVWRLAAELSPANGRRFVAERAVARYGYILEEIDAGAMQ